VQKSLSCIVLCVLLPLSLGAQTATPKAVPIVRDVDIVIAGGGCGAVAAAESAAQAGATVLVITSRNYLGEDIAGTMQLWLEPGEEPGEGLAQRLYNDPFARDEPGLHYTYTADRPSQKRHPDTAPPSRLRRTRSATDPQHESVQYENDVTITADLGKIVSVREIAANAFRRPRDFEVKDLAVQTSPDGEAWRDLGRFRCIVWGDRQEFTVPIKQPARYVRMLFTRQVRCQRILLGDIKFVAATVEQVTTEASAIRPLHAKKALERTLQNAGVPFLFGTYPTGLLRDSTGRVSGLVMSNRMGRQAVRAKVVLDCTEHAVLARLAGVPLRKPQPAETTVRWVTIAGEPTTRDGLTVRKLPFPVSVYDIKGRRAAEKQAAWYECALTQERADDLASRMALETRVRELCYNPTQLFTADIPLVIPGAQIMSRAATDTEWRTTDAFALESCQPVQTEGLWVLGGYSDVSRGTAGKLLRPVNMIVVGARLGRLLATRSTDLPETGTATVATGAPSSAPVPGEVREALAGLRPGDSAQHAQDPGHPLPVLGQYDVVVVGGGTSGAPAGIAAARHGARTLVLEYLHGLGGVGTLGMIGKYWYGNRVGFARESPENPIEARMHFYLSELRKAGGEVWFGTLGCGALTEGNRVTGVIVATPFGRGIVKANVVVDGTGNADIAAAAGAQTQFVEPFFALQKSHIPPREVGASYINGNRTPIDAADPVDVTAAMMTFPDRSFDRGQIVASRERQRIIGDYELDWLDQLNRRTFPDTITYARSDYDSHGYQTHAYFMLRPARQPGKHRKQFHSYVPYRCLLPRGLDGILVVGLGISAHRDAMPIVRMQPDLQNIGYAAGIAATMAAGSKCSLRGIDIKALQAHLIEAGILDRRTKSHADSYPVKQATLTEAVAALPQSYSGLGTVLAEPTRALPLLRQAYTQTDGHDRLAYAHVLGILGDATGVPALVSAANAILKTGDLKHRKESDGMDRGTQLMWALGRSRAPAAIDALAALTEAGAVNSGGRFRAVAVSLGATGSRAAIPALQKLLRDQNGNGSANELMAACALRQCGDRGTDAEPVLERAATGTNGPLARLAQSMLGE
jgi:glycine/D-amino acid oxidase-like deaminating enzyme